MSSKTVLSSANGFKHVCRPLKEGESVPRLPTLLEQVMACRFELPSTEDEIVNEDEYLDDDLADEEFADDELPAYA